MWLDLLSEEALRYIQLNEGADTTVLALRDSKKNLGFQLSAAIEQIALRKKAKKKLINWHGTKGIIFPSRLALEQCSSEAAAAYKAHLIGGELLVDLTGGMGVDSSFFADQFNKVTYVEPNEELNAITKHNFGQLGKSNIECVASTAEEFLTDSSICPDYFFIDPSRRDHHRKTFLLEETIPNITLLHDTLLSRAKGYLLKASPILDIRHLIDTLPTVAALHVLSVDGEVKELLALCGREKCHDINVHAVNLKHNGAMEAFSFMLNEEAGIENHYSMPQRYLYEPNASIMKAGAFKSIGARFGLTKLQVNSHLYTSEDFVEDFPGRVFEILAAVKPSRKEIAKCGVGKFANVATRNYPSTASELQQSLGLSDGGDWYLFGTTLINGSKVVVVSRKVASLQE